MLSRIILMLLIISIAFSSMAQTCCTAGAPISSFPVVAVDQDGNRIDMFGEFVDGPRQGDNLIPLNSYMGYFFAFGAFYEDMELYE